MNGLDCMMTLLCNGDHLELNIHKGCLLELYSNQNSSHKPREKSLSEICLQSKKMSYSMAAEKEKTSCPKAAFYINSLQDKTRGPLITRRHILTAYIKTTCHHLLYQIWSLKIDIIVVNINQT